MNCPERSGNLTLPCAEEDLTTLERASMDVVDLAVSPATDLTKHDPRITRYRTQEQGKNDNDAKVVTPQLIRAHIVAFNSNVCVDHRCIEWSATQRSHQIDCRAVDISTLVSSSTLH
jgi:hypothetical protein